MVRTRMVMYVLFHLYLVIKLMNFRRLSYCVCQADYQYFIALIRFQNVLVEQEFMPSKYHYNLPLMTSNGRLVKILFMLKFGQHHIAQWFRHSEKIRQVRGSIPTSVKPIVVVFAIFQPILHTLNRYFTDIYFYVVVRLIISFLLH